MTVLEPSGISTTARLLTLDEVADHLQLTPDAVRRHVRKGDLSAHRIGGRLRFRPLDLEAYIDARRVTPNPPPAPAVYGQVVSAPSAVPPRTTAPTSFRERARRANQRDAA